MADISDVEIALVGLLNTAFGPGAAFWQGGLSSARVFRGKPQQFSVTADRAKSIYDISVLALAGPCETTTRWLGASYTVSVPPGVTVEVSGASARFTGVANTGDLIGCVAGGLAYSYLAKGGENAALIAATLCQMVRTSGSCTLSGATLTVPVGESLQALSYGPARTLVEIGRQIQPIEITLWCPSATMRDVLGGGITGHLDANSFLALSDGSTARLRYHATSIDDTDTPASFYIRKIVYSAEFSTFSAVDAGTMLFGSLNYNAISLLL